MDDEHQRVKAGGRNPIIFLSVGEPSGDLHGAALARALREKLPEARLIGLGGERMAAEGVELLADLDDLAVMGFVEVLSRLPFFIRLRRRVFERLAAENVDLVVPVDYPGFNLRLARHAHAEGRRVLYYIAPQVWAWHVSRTEKLARDTDRVAVILPFEEAFLRERGVDAEFVGHPLLDGSRDSGMERTEWCATEGIDPALPLLALMPGSRRQEIERHLDLFVATARQIEARRPEIQVRIGASAGLPAEVYTRAPYPTIRTSPDLLRHATAALVKSGTTTLETALAETPFAVVYRMNPLTYRLARRVVRVPHIALANLVAGRRVAPEFVQAQATPEALAETMLKLLDPESREHREMVAGLREVKAALGKGGAAARVAEIAADLIADQRVDRKSPS